jgi:hypothetical protein
VSLLAGIIIAAVCSAVVIAVVRVALAVAGRGKDEPAVCRLCDRGDAGAPCTCEQGCGATACRAYPIRRAER